MNPALLLIPASDWPGLVTSQVSAATLLLPLQAVGAVAMKFAELITTTDVSSTAMAVGLTGVFMEPAQVLVKNGGQTSVAYEFLRLHHCHYQCLSDNRYPVFVIPFLLVA